MYFEVWGHTIIVINCLQTPEDSNACGPMACLSLHRDLQHALDDVSQEASPYKNYRLNAVYMLATTLGTAFQEEKNSQYDAMEGGVVTPKSTTLMMTKFDRVRKMAISLGMIDKKQLQSLIAPEQSSSKSISILKEHKPAGDQSKAESVIHEEGKQFGQSSIKPITIINKHTTSTTPVDSNNYENKMRYPHEAEHDASIGLASLS